MMNKPIPKRLRSEPLIESIWEIRFSSEVRSVGNVLPGFVFNGFASEYQIEPLPAGNVPRELREADPNLIFAPTVRLSLPPYSIQIGDRVLSFNCSRPYSGRATFGEKIRALASVVEQTGLIKKLERFSMRYIDIIPSSGPSLEPLDAVVKVAGKDLSKSSSLIRAETEEGEFINILQIASSVALQVSESETLSGILVENDTIYGKESSWSLLREKLDALHELNKKLFFDVLKPETIAALGPEY
jgi:uncharacterized protein (TIGR04255 family)